MKNAQHKKSRHASRQASVLSALLLAWATSSGAATWTPVTNFAPSNTGTMLQMTDGTILVQNNSSSYKAWNRLSPSSTGSYIAGTWSPIASMALNRLYFASHILRNGDVWVLGGEYSGVSSLSANWTNTGEKYNILTNTWSPIASHPDAQYGDVPSMLLDGDKILAGSLFTRNTYLYDIASNSWSFAAAKFNNDRSDEESWVKISGGKVLTYDLFQSIATGGAFAELYNPVTNSWASISPSDGTAFGTIPQLSSAAVGYEIGAGVRLCDGRIFLIGGGDSAGIGHTALYTPSTNTWAPGPDIPDTYIADDAPATLMPNCHVLLAANSNHFSGPTRLYDYNPGTSSMTQVVTPSGLTSQLNGPVYITRMLMLPTGQVLFSASTNQLWVYTPDGTPDSQLRPVVNNVTYDSAAGVFHLTGRRLTGSSAGGSYGDDVESDQNYPIIRLQSRTGVYYTRTSNWSTTDVGTDTALLTTDFCLKPGTPAGNYTMVMSAAGIQSYPIAFTVDSSMASCK